MTRLTRLWGLLPLLALLQLAFVRLYLAHEDTLHFWDYAMYANMAIGWFHLPDLSQSLDVFFSSFSQKYNLLFALPSSIAFLIGGATRDHFILTNALVYFVPYQLAMGVVLKIIYRQSWPFSLGGALFLGWMIPFAWYPLLQGYPDHSAATCLVLAIALCLRNKQTWKTALAAGALMGLAIVLRRHYAYPALSLLVAMGLHDAFVWLKESGDRLLKQAKAEIKKFSLLVTGLLGVLLTLEPLYLIEIITTNYQSLYKSYEQPTLYFILFAFSRVGLVLLGASLAGYGHAAYLYSGNRKKLGFIVLLFVTWIVLWALGPSQAGDHYLISVMPLFLMVGLFAPVARLSQNRSLIVPVFVIALLLFAGSARALWFSPFVIPSQHPEFSLFASPRPPWVRGDLAELKRLGKYLQETTTDKDKIVVVGSSFILNQDLIRAVYTDVIKDIQTALRFIPAPESDGEQDPPLDVFSAANVYIVPEPAQYHLPREGQKVVTALASRFPPVRELEEIIKPDAARFTLDNGVEVSVWRRGPWPPAKLHAQLQEMRKYKDMQRRWILSATEGLSVFNHPSFLTIFVHGPSEKKSSLFFDRVLTSTKGRVRADYELGPACVDLKMSARLTDKIGDSLGSKVMSAPQQTGSLYLPFEVRRPNEEGAYLFLDIETHSPTQCTVALKQLDIEQ